MLLIPIGAEEDGSRAKPVATIALIALNVIWYVVLNFSPGASAWKSEIETARKDVEQYWSEHPDLTPPESLARLLGAEEFDELAQHVKEAAAKRRPAMAWLDDLQRRELERRALRLEEALANRPAHRYGFVPAHPTALGALGSLFTHAGLVHLAGNMLFLWAVGPFVESALGAGLFSLLYLTGGAAALLAHRLASGPSPEPLVGASGAIAGVMGALLVRNAFAKIRFLWLPILWAPRLRLVFGIPAFVVLPLWFLEQVTSAKLEPDAPVAWWAHIGGFVFGMAGAAVLVRGPKGKPAPAPGPVRRAMPAAKAPAVSPLRAPGYGSARRASSSSVPAAPAPRPRARARLRVAVVSSGTQGGLVLTRGMEPIFRRSLDPVPAGSLALDETVELADGPADLRIELRLGGGGPRFTAVPAVLKAGETRVLRIEPRPSGVAAELR
jgi:membrane associated rhomboid family serine protease